MRRFESILIPIEWNVDNFDLYLNPGTSPSFFLPWLANWFTIIFDDSWNEEKRRTLLNEAHLLYARRGTRWAVSRILEIYTGQTPEIIEFAEDIEPFTFKVRFKQKVAGIDNDLLERLIDTNKPAQTTYTIEYSH